MTRTALTTAGLAALALLAGTASTVPSSAADSAGPETASRSRTLPEAIGARPKVRQMVTISSARWGSTSATLKAWRRNSHGHWVLAHGPVSARLGYGGWVRAAHRRQSTGTTPAGRFRLPYAFGRLADPGTALRYRRYDGNDWWPYEPRDAATYNVYQRHRAAATRWRPDYAEHLADYPGQYAYAIVVDFNRPSGVHYSKRRRQWVATDRADTSRGGGIFLHVNGKGKTAGCVSMPRSDVRWLLRWLGPRRVPQVVMGPHDYIVRL